MTTIMLLQRLLQRQDAASHFSRLSLGIADWDSSLKWSGNQELSCGRWPKKGKLGVTGHCLWLHHDNV